MKKAVIFLFAVLMFMVSPMTISVSRAAGFNWATATDAEVRAYIESGQVDYGSGDAAMYERLQAYHNSSVIPERDQINTENEAQARRDALVSLSSTSGEHGLVTNKMKNTAGIYRDEGYSFNGNTSYKYSDATIDLSESSGVNAEVEKDGIFDMVIELLGKLLYFLANSVDNLLSSGGMALDNIIFGRVGGNGVQLKGVGDNPIVSFFTFELQEGNPYGVIAAILYQKVREIAYLAAVIFCMVKLIKVGLHMDYERMKMERQTFIENALLCFSLMVFMPYFFDLYLFIRDIALKGIAIGTLQDLFGATGFLEAFREGAKGYDLIPCILYFGAVIASVMFAAIYVAYAMCMVVHFVLFPAVCVRAIGNRNLLGEWVDEAVGLTIMPIVDGMLLMIPLTFSSIGNGIIVMQFLALVSCAMLLTARRQARRSLGIRDNGAVENGALASVMGAAHLAKGVAKGFRRSVGRMAAGWKEAKSDNEMADYYDEQARAEKSATDGEPAIEAPVSMSSNVPTYQEAQAMGLSKEGAPLYSAAPDMKVESPGNAHRYENEVYAKSTVLDDSAEMGASDEPGLATGYVQRMTGLNTVGPDPIAEKYANADNFESRTFQGKLSNEKLAQLYKARARKTLLKSFGGGVGAMAGGVAGGAVGFGAGAFMGSGMQSFLTGTGIDVGSAAGGVAGEGAVSLGYGAAGLAKAGAQWGAQSLDKIAFETMRQAAMSSMEHYSDAEVGSELRVQQGSSVRASAPTEEQMREHRAAALKNFFVDNGGQNFMSYTADMTEAASAAEKIVPHTFPEAMKNDVNGNLKMAHEQYANSGREESDRQAFKDRINAEREKVNSFKREELRKSFERSLDNDANASFNKNNQVHRDAFNATMHVAEEALSNAHRLYSDEYTKNNLDIDFQKWERMAK